MKWLEPMGTFIIACLAGLWSLLYPLLILVGVYYFLYGIIILFNL